jgi:hypothetical protein
VSAAVEERLHPFATTLLERRGALVDWPAPHEPGSALLPPEVAAAVGAPGEVVPLGCTAGQGGLAVNLAGDFLEWAGRLLECEPRVGVFRIREPYLKRKDLGEAVARSFAWLNAKVRIHDIAETAIEYHTWWFHGSLASEDRWETCFAVSLNAVSGVEVKIPDPLGRWDLEPRPGPFPAPPPTSEAAQRAAQRQLLQLASGFLQRLDGRLQRDRKRLSEYYHALLREADHKRGRGHAPPDPEKIEAHKRAVHLELRRKLGELDERYAIEATLLPVVLVRTEVPVLAVELSVFRKQASRQHRVYWNPLTRQFDPMACGCCAEGVFSVAFTNETVEPRCARCSGEAGRPRAA